MGMFDELRCEYPLPDGFKPPWPFQTQDTPAQHLELYVLTADGRLRHERTGDILPYHGALTFYTTNICASGSQGVITKDNTPPWWAEYVALFDHGTLLNLKGNKHHETDRPWVNRPPSLGLEAL